MIDPTQLPPGLVVPVRVDRRGGHAGPTPDEARGPRWRRTSRGFYVPSHTDGNDVGQRILEAAVLVPPGCAITGWAALRWCGGHWFDGATADGGFRAVPIALGTCDVRPQPIIRRSGEGLGPRHIVWHRGLPVTVPAYATSYEMRHAPDVEAAAAILSMACYSDLVSIDEQTAFLTPGQNGWTGVPQARKAVALAHENLWSPKEQPLLNIWRGSGAGRMPSPNVPVFSDTGRHLLTPDLIDVRAGVVGEYNGRVHRSQQVYRRDLERWELYRQLELEHVVMTAADLDRPGVLLDRIERAYVRAARVTSTRRWTTQPPRWWVPTETVEQRRSLTDDERRRFLRHRGA